MNDVKNNSSMYLLLDIVKLIFLIITNIIGTYYKQKFYIMRIFFSVLWKAVILIQEHYNKYICVLKHSEE